MLRWIRGLRAPTFLSPFGSVPPLALLEASDAVKVEEIGPTSAEGVEAELNHKRFIESLGVDPWNRAGSWV